MAVSADLRREAKLLYVLGRGPSYPIAAETALKLKETCAIHAEAYSAAEVMHGPLELEPGFPLLVYAQDDAALPGTRAAVKKLEAMGADVGAAGGPVIAEAIRRPPIPMSNT